MSEISPDEYLDWKRSKVTKAVMAALDDNCKMIMNNWSNGAYRSDDPHVSAAKNAEMIGQLQGFKSLLLAITDNKVVPITEVELDA